MNNDTKPTSKVWLAALAGLLHDIGKFSQRAGKLELTDRQALGEVKYEHALYSDSFVRVYVPDGWQAGITAPRQHHNPQSDQDYQVQLADWLSSGEREEDEDNQIPYLRSIFSRLKGYDRPMLLPLKRLALDEATLFANERPDNTWKKSHQAEYAKHWDNFESACKQAGLKEFVPGQEAAYLETLYSLLMEYTWCVPSASYHSIPDVSLFDHARTTAALAACLAADGRDGEWCKRVANALTTDGSDEVCLLVGGDISGVQSFLYTLTSSGAAKSLRARSFYLQLLTEVVAQYVLDELGLPITNLLYAGGGNFFILMGTGKRDDLAHIRREVSRKLLEAHDGTLHLALTAVAVKASEFKRGQFWMVWDNLHQQLAIEKRRPMADLDPAQLAQEIGFAGGEGGDTNRVCNVCGRESQAELQQDRKDETVRKCNFCASLETLGAQLSHATHLVWLKSSTRDSVVREPSDWWYAMMAFGANVYAINANELSDKDQYIGYWPKGLTFVQVNQLQAGSRYEKQLLGELAKQSAPVVTTYRPFAQLVPFRGKDQVLTFDELAEESQGVRRWGVLRMDVDNLGDLFRYGFVWSNEQGKEENNLTLSRVASLSFALRLFFEGWLPKLGEAQWPHGGDDPASGRIYPNTLYVQYAGGDDVFVVGAWNALPEFAARIRESFGLYVGHNPDITISAGITLADQKFPLYLAAEQAAEAEQAAKNYHRPDGKEKDALCLFEQAIGWEQFKEVSHRARLMTDWCEGAGAQQGKSLPKSIIQSFLAIDAEFQRGAVDEGRNRSRSKHRRGQFYYGPWVWHAVYKLTRTINATEKLSADAARILGQWEEQLLDPSKSNIVTMGLSARWAELLTRKESKNE